MSKKNEYEQSFALNSAFKTNYNDSTSSFTYVFPEKLTNVINKIESLDFVKEKIIVLPIHDN